MPPRSYRSISIIHNPRAGRLLRRPERVERAAEILRKTGAAVQLIATTGPGSAGQIAGECVRRGSDLVLVAGGDGTLNEALNGMPGCDVPLGILPGGTANVLAMELGIGSRMRSVAARLGEFVPCPVSAGLLRCREIPKGRHFLLMAGAGLDAAIVQKVSLPLKAATGKFAYWVAGLCKLPELVTPLSVRSESGARRCGFALVSRVRNYGGDLSIARSVSLTDDDFEVVLFEGRVPLRYGVYFAALLAGVHARLPGVTVFRSRKLELEPAGAKEVHIQIDGELAGSLPATVEIVPQAIQLLVPPSYLVNRAESPWTTSHTHSRA